MDKFITLSDGRKLCYIEYGDPKGKPLFFFHGWPGSRLSGVETDEAARKLKVRVISIDRPGFGKSDYKRNRKLLDWPDDVIQLADKLKVKKFSINGVSGGGPYAAVCAYKIPERLIKVGIVVGFAPIDIKGNLDGMATLNKFCWKNYHRFSFLRTLSTVSGLVGWKYFPVFTLLFGFGAKEDKLLIKNKFSKRMDNSLGEAYRQGIKGPNLDLKIYTDPWGFKIKDIKAKVYLWYGAKDENVSLNMGKYYKSQIAKSKLFIDPNGGHLFRNNIEEEILACLTD